jgi:hypothetical protein
MINPNKLALIVAYFLARFDRKGLDRLGFSSFNKAFEETAKRLGVKKNYVKLRRDEFDPVFSWRIGWQRPMDRQIIKTIEAFQEMDEAEVFHIVSEILNNEGYRQGEEANEITTILEEGRNENRKKGKFILRAPTGKSAEEFFIEHFKNNAFPVRGNLIDTRDLGCGHDFKIESENHTLYIEVKGTSEISGGIVFTHKEWHTALISGNNYYW